MNHVSHWLHNGRFIGVYMQANLNIQKISKHKSDFSDLNSDEFDVSDTNVGNIGSEHVILNTLGLEEELRCIMCTNQNKSVSGCDGACQVNEHLFKAIIDMIDNRIETKS